MNKNHLNYRLSLELDICTDKEKTQLETFLKSELNNIAGIYLLVTDIQTHNVALCDCDSFEENNDDGE